MDEISSTAWVDEFYRIELGIAFVNDVVKNELIFSAKKYSTVMKEQKVTEREMKLFRELTAHIKEDILSKCVASYFECDSTTATLILEGSNW